MKLKKLEVNSFAGIGPDSPVIIDFGTSKMVKVTGDNSVGKTSLLNALLVALGHLSRENKNFVNKDSGKIDIKFDFVGKDRANYTVQVTKSEFKLLYEGERQPEPIAKMKELLGVPGVSPMEIKNSKLKDIVKWLAQYAGKSAEDYEKRYGKLKEGIKSAQETRAAANKAAKGIREYFISEGVMNKDGDIIEKVWLANEKKFKEDVDLQKLSKELTAAGNKSDKFIENKSKVEGQVARKKQITDQITALQKELVTVEENIKVGNDWLEKNKDAQKEYDAVKARYNNAAQESADYRKWKEIEQKKRELDQFEDVSQKADDKEKSMLAEVKELQAELIPDLKGVELLLEPEYKDGKKIRDEGFYRDEVNSAQMSETEWHAVVFEMLQKNKNNKILVLDNIQSLGSDGMAVIEKLLKLGFYIVGAEMHRGQKELAIELS